MAIFVKTFTLEEYCSHRYRRSCIKCRKTLRGLFDIGFSTVACLEMVPSVRLLVFFCQGEHELAHSNCRDVLCVSFVHLIFIPIQRSTNEKPTRALRQGVCGRLGDGNIFENIYFRRRLLSQLQEKLYIVSETLRGLFDIVFSTVACLEIVPLVRLHLFFCQGEHELADSNCCDVLCVSFVH